MKYLLDAWLLQNLIIEAEEGHEEPKIFVWVR